MTTNITRYLLTLIFLVLTGLSLTAQNAPVTTAATVGGAGPGIIDVPITVTGFNNIGAVSLTIDYDYSVLNFIDGTPNPLLDPFPIGDIDLSTGYHRITMGWYGPGVSLDNGSTVMTLHFIYISGITLLSWYDNGPSCEYADADYNVLNDIPTGDYYINGYVCGALPTPGLITGSTAVCQGQTGEMYSVEPVINATGYLWSVPEGATIIIGQNTNSIIVDYSNEAVSGDVSVYGMNFCGNGPPSELPVTVNPLPVADAGNDTTINYGTSTTLHAAPGGSGTYSYHWSPEELLVDPDVQDPQTVILTESSIFTVLVTNQESLCQQGDEVVVTITGGPLSINPTTFPGIICKGWNAQLYSNAGGGSGNYTYAWTCIPPGSPPWTSDLANPVISPDSSTHYLLSVFDGFTSVSGSTDLSVNQLPTATISGGDTLCGDAEFTTLQVDLTGVSPWSFTYTYGNTSVIVTDQQTSPYFITASDPGDYIITALEDADCPGLSYGIAIVRKYPIPVTPEISIYGYELISSSCCGNQWYRNDTLIPGATEQTYHVIISGLYFVIVTMNTCSSEPSDVVDIIVGIDENVAGQFTFYPNPASDFVTIQTTHQVKGILKVTLCSANGIVVKDYYLNNAGKYFTLNIDVLPEGLYFLVFSYNGETAAGKLLVR